jgi:hypothetical protein
MMQILRWDEVVEPADGQGGRMASLGSEQVLAG